MAIPSIVLGASLGSLGNNLWRDIPYLSLGFCLKNYGFWGQHSPFMSSTSIQTFSYLNLLVTFIGFYMVFLYMVLLTHPPHPHLSYPHCSLNLSRLRTYFHIICFYILHPTSFYLPQPSLLLFSSLASADTSFNVNIGLNL